MTDEEIALSAEGTLEETGANGSAYRLRFVAHDRDAFELFYDVMANPVLWFVQHVWALKHDPDDDLTRAWYDGSSS